VKEVWSWRRIEKKLYDTMLKSTMDEFEENMKMRERERERERERVGTE
jgi:hypothetical protein